ncbi:hypothetical protein ACU4HD_21895 [Cupriavidus basilensis]
MTRIAMAFCTALALSSFGALGAGGVIATMPNKSDGRIELTDIPTPEGGSPACQGKRIAKTWANGADDLYGCWNFGYETVEIHWVNGSDRTYRMRDFTPTPYARKLAGDR